MKQQVNLLTDDLKPKRDPLSLGQLLSLWGAFAAVLVVFSGWGGASLWQLADEEAEKREQWRLLQKTNEQLKSSTSETADPTLEAEVTALKSNRADQERLMAALMHYHTDQAHGFSHYLNDLAEHQVDGMWLSRITLSDGGGRIQLQGVTLDPQHLPLFLRELSKGEAFNGHRFDELTLEETDDGLLEFDLVGPDLEEDA